MTTTTKALRRDLEAAVAAIGAPWNLSPAPWLLHAVDDSVPDPAPSTTAHGSFSVGVPESSWLDQDRQVPSLGTTTQTFLSVRYFARVVPHDSGTSQDVCDDLEAALIAAALAISTGWTIKWTACERSVVPTGEFFQRDVTFRAQHRLPLE